MQKQNRKSQRLRCLAGIGIGVILLQGGCAGFLGHLGYWSGASLIPPEYAGLEGRRVAVICVSDGASYGMGTEDQLLARRVANMLSEEVREIEVVPASEVADWVDKNDWDALDYREVGTGVKADRVVAIDMAGFRLKEDPVFYKGFASLTVTVFDMEQEGKEVFRRMMPEVTHPETGYYPTSDSSEATFRQVFLRVLARRVARHFFAYDKLGESTLAPASAG